MIRERMGLAIGIVPVLVASVATAGHMKPAFSTQQVFAQMIQRKTTGEEFFGVSPSNEPAPAPDRRRTAPRLDGEFLIDTSTTLGRRGIDALNTAEAFDGTNYLLVWEDQGFGQVRGARLTQAGVFVDSVCIRMPKRLGHYQSRPDVAFDGANYLVVWGDGGDICGARVSPDGRVLDPDQIPISTGASGEYAPALAWDGENYLVVWDDFRNPPFDIYGARVTPAGQVLDPDGIPISTATSSQKEPQVDFRGSDFLVVWTDSRRSSETLDCYDIYGARVSLAGVVLDSAGIPIDTSVHVKGRPRIASITTDSQVTSLVVWQDESLGIRGARISEGGQVLDTAGLSIRSPRGGRIAANDDIASDGANYVVAWIEAGATSAGLYAARVTGFGQVIDTSGVAIFSVSRFRSPPASLFAGARQVLTWGALGSLYCVRATPDLANLDTAIFSVQFCPNSEDYSAAAFDGVNYLVAWGDNRSSSEDIYCARVTPTGVNLDPLGIAVSDSAWTQTYPGVAFDGANFLVSWCDGRLSGDTSPAVFAARVSPSGSVLDPEGILVSAGQSGANCSNVTFDGADFLVTWTGSDCRAYAARVSPAGAVLDTQAIVLCQTPGAQVHPAAASNGAVSLVAWSDFRNGIDLDIYGTRIDHSGRVLDPAGIPIGADSGNQDYPSVAADGQGFFAAWEDGVERPLVSIRGARVTAQGAVQDTPGIPIALRVNDQRVPTVGVAFDGRNYVVAWPDYAHSTERGIHGATVSPEGAVVDTFPIAVSAEQPCLSLTRGAGMQTLCTYTVATDTWQGKYYDVDRIWGRIRSYSGVQDGFRSTPLDLRLSASPNPCRGATTISYSLPKATKLSLRLYDVSGKVVTTVLEGKAGPGVQQFELRASELPRGVYMLRLCAGAGRLTRKLVID